MDLVVLLVVGRLIYKYAYGKNDPSERKGDMCSDGDSSVKATLKSDEPVAVTSLPVVSTATSSRADRSILRKKYSPKSIDDSDIDTIVIGSGMSGLSCAAILGRLGKKVLVLEQHNDVAGNAR